MFELVVDGLFTIFDLDESNDLDREEFNFLTSTLKECCVPDSTYRKVATDATFNFDEAKKCDKGCDELNLLGRAGLTRG